MNGEFPHQENKSIDIEFWNNGSALGLKRIWLLECVLL